MKARFKLVQLSKQNSAGIEIKPEVKMDIPTALSRDRFNALFDYFKKGSGWTGHEIAIVQCTRIDHTDEGEDIPIDPVLIDVEL